MLCSATRQLSGNKPLVDYDIIECLEMGKTLLCKNTHHHIEMRVNCWHPSNQHITLVAAVTGIKRRSEAKFRLTNDTIELENIETTPQQKGIGALLTHIACIYCLTKNIKTYTVKNATFDVRAFYEKLGFKAITEEDRYLQINMKASVASLLKQTRPRIRYITIRPEQQAFYPYITKPLYKSEPLLTQ